VFPGQTPGVCEPYGEETRLELPEDWRERLGELVNDREEREKVEGKRK
jgi:hypothetical protein